MFGLSVHITTTLEDLSRLRGKTSLRVPVDQIPCTSSRPENRLREFHCNDYDLIYFASINWHASSHVSTRGSSS